MKFAISHETRLGARQANQDKIGYLYTSQSLLMIVCDGMGGHVGGEIASQFVVDYLANAYKQVAKPKVNDPLSFMKKSIASANAALIQYAKSKNYPEVPRTTCVAVLVQDGKMQWINVGDSRIYHIRNDEVVLKTIDHSQVQQMVEAGVITEQEAKKHKDRNKIYNCIGQSAPPKIDVEKDIVLKPNDCVLLATDGLWGPIGNTMLEGTFNTMPTSIALPWLMDLAESTTGKGCDNLSGIAFKWLEDGAEESKIERVEEPTKVVFDDELLSITVMAMRDAIAKTPELPI